MNNDDSPQYRRHTDAVTADEPQQAVPADEIPEDENLVDEPLADKGDVTAPMHDTDDPLNNATGVPGVDPDSLDELRDESRQAIDFEEGRMRDVNLTQGQTVVDAAFEDRGPATHTHPEEER